MTESMPPIIVADGGQLTILRSLAAFCYGTWATEWHASTPEEMRLKPPDGSEFGYAARLGHDPGVMGRRFVRRDIKNIQGADMGLQVGHSETEQTLDDAAKLTQGHVFFEKDFTRENLGGLVPRVDFDVDDLVIVAMWGKALLAPVTMIEDVTEVGKVLDWNVKVGGSLIRDDRARERALLELETQIADELAKVDQVARSASNTASSAKQKAEAAATQVTNKLAELKTAMATATEGAERAKQAADRVEGLNRELAALADEMRPEIEAIPGHLKKLANGVQLVSAASALVSNETALAQAQLEELARVRAELDASITEAKRNLGESESKRAEVAKLLTKAEGARDEARRAVTSAEGALREVNESKAIAKGDYQKALELHQKAISSNSKAIKANALSSAMNAQAISSLSQAQELLAAAVQANTESLENVAVWQGIQEDINDKQRRINESQDRFNTQQTKLNQDLEAATRTLSNAQLLQVSINEKQQETNKALAKGLAAASEATSALTRITTINSEVAKKAQEAARSATKASNANREAIANVRKVNDSQDDFARWLDESQLGMWSGALDWRGGKRITNCPVWVYRESGQVVYGELQGGDDWQGHALIMLRADNGAMDTKTVWKTSTRRTSFRFEVGDFFKALNYDHIVIIWKRNLPVPRRR